MLGSGRKIHFAGHPKIMDAGPQPVIHFLQGAQRELARLGHPPLTLRLPADPLSEAPPDPDEVAGYLYFAYYRSEGWFRFFFKQPDIPLALVDPHDSSPWQFPEHARFLRLRADHRGAGRQLAYHLAAMGHRRIAFLSHLPTDQDWLQARLEGLEEGLGVGTYPSSRSVEFLGPEPEGEPVSHDAGYTLQVSRFFQSMIETGRLPAQLVKERLNSAYDLSASLHAAFQMEPVFDRLLQEGSATVWVCVNDELAALAQHFLKANGVEVPETISVAGFDDSHLALRLGLTSYDLGFDAAGALAVQLLLNPPPCEPGEAHVANMPGLLLARNSTAPMRSDPIT